MIEDNKTYMIISISLLYKCKVSHNNKKIQKFNFHVTFSNIL
jgi:hypothetical protein